MIVALLMATLLAAEPNQQQAQLLQTFRQEFVQLTPGEGDLPATFTRGNPTAASRRLVAVTPFAIAKYEVPQNLYESVMGENPSRWKGPRNSVEEVSYNDAKAFCRKATRLMRAARLIESNQVIRLPTENEWEYACKAGTTTRYSFGNEIDKLDEYAWHTGNAAGNDPPVGAKQPNPWGLYDMHGYLWEWTATRFSDDPNQPASPQTDQRVVKGGSWQDAAEKLVSHYRVGRKENAESDALGLRCVLAQIPVAGADEFPTAGQQQMVPAGAEVKLLWNEGEFTEGPAWSPEGHLLFSDIGNTIYRYEPTSGKVSLYRKPSGRANGLAFNSRGELIACEGANDGGRRISLTSNQGKVRTLADSYRGKRFNSPNDLAMDPRGNVYFTDPRYVGDEPRQLDFEGVFLVATDGQTRLATREVAKPNGIALTAEGRHCYVADHDSRPGGPRHLLRFEVGLDGTLKNKQVLYDFGSRRGIDGMTLDAEGNVYATAGSGVNAGIYVFGPQGKKLAMIPLPGAPTNCTFGQGKWANTLFITAQGPEPQEGSARKYALYQIDLGKQPQ